jgi:hypothetical protein
MSVSFAAVFVKLSNRRRGKTATVTCGRICHTVALSTISLGVGYFLANGNRAGQRLNADEVFFCAL